MFLDKKEKKEIYSMLEKQWTWESWWLWFIERSEKLNLEFFFKKKNKEIIGILITGPNPSDWKFNWLYLLIIKEEFRWKWIWTELINKAKKKYKHLIVDVWEEDELAKKFYLKNNFEIIGFNKRWFWDENDSEGAYIMKTKYV